MKILINASFIIFLFLGGCSKKAVDIPADELRNIEKQEIITSYNAISAVADKMLLDIPNDKLQMVFEAKVAEFKKQAAVEDVAVTSNATFVKFKKGGVVGWMYNPADKDLPLDDLQSITPEPKQELIQSATISAKARTAAAEYPGNKKVCLINQMSNDKAREKRKATFDFIENKFIKNGYQVDRVDRKDMTIDFMKTQLNKYGIVFLSTHGGMTNSSSCLITGEYFLGKGAEYFFNNDYEQLWLKGEIIPMSIQENNEISSYYAITEKFIENNYKDHSFPNSQIMISACQSAKDTTHFLKTFRKKGARVVVGWSDIQGIGWYTNSLILGLMLNGLNFTEALRALPDKYSEEFINNNPIVFGSAKIISSPATLDYRLVPLSPVPKNGLVAYYPFDGDTKDKSGNGNDGQMLGIGGMSYVDGQKGRGIYFPKEYDLNNPNRILVKAAASLKFEDGWTYSFWINIKKAEFDEPISNDCIYGAGFSQFPKAIFDRYENKLAGKINSNLTYDFTPVNGYGLILRQAQNNELFGYRFQREIDVFNAWGTLGYGKINSEEYTHICFVGEKLSNSTVVIKIYCNSESGSGNQFILGRDEWQNILNVNYDILVGALNNHQYFRKSTSCPNVTFDKYQSPLREATLDEFRIYNRALTENEIRQLYELDKKK